ncbi:NAD(P)H dehydrogenase [Eikenella longinqua]|uniref:NAD(P)H dehydrogenase n=1 Tax=Eikenella longinqua TaxID=1795827 RepID=A0A1A9S2V7_9NEIS|nr:NAD(P)H dehydrogenase [Eikenella longinqua]
MPPPYKNLEHSVSNRLILEELDKHFGGQASVRRLSELYPDFNIDVAAEQAALVDADIVLLQYPTYWFNTPAILKKWLDDVWTYGFAYGTGGDKLHGKKLFVSTTIGSGKENYDGNIAPLVADLVKPVEASALYSGFDWQGVEPLYGQLYIPGVNSEEDLARVQQKARDHAAKLIAKIEKLA